MMLGVLFVFVFVFVLDMLVSLVNKRDCWVCGMLLLEG